MAGTVPGGPDARPPRGRPVLDGAFALLEALAAHDEDLGLTRLAEHAGLPKTTAHRLLDQLVTLGAVQRRAGRYRVGSLTFRLGQAWQPAQLLRTATAQPLRRLTLEFAHVGLSVAVPDGGGPLLVAGIRGEVDELFTLRAGAVLPPGTAAEVLFAPAAPPPGQSGRAWSRRVVLARDRGVAYDHEECVPGLFCVAAPVRGPSGNVVAAINATVFDPRRLTPLADALRRAAAMAGTNLTRLPAPG
ncbi:IclR family transcriptional regulator [Streptomyces sp. NPDC001118]|uniref:IclR family transcriptional regulator n=1 Tax=unclassified Streptomyces TaxID=2593676 RepID=UPI00332F21CD